MSARRYRPPTADVPAAHAKCALCSPTAYVLQDVLTETATLDLNRQRFQRSAFSQIQDLKALLRDLKRKRRDDRAEQEVHEMSSAVFAEVFLKLRNSLNDYWNDLKDEEKVYTTDVLSARKLLLQSVNIKCSATTKNMRF